MKKEHSGSEGLLSPHAEVVKSFLYVLKAKRTEGNIDRSGCAYAVKKMQKGFIRILAITRNDNK
jgi:hypothetical protein